MAANACQRRYMAATSRTIEGDKETEGQLQWRLIGIDGGGKKRFVECHGAPPQPYFVQKLCETCHQTTYQDKPGKNKRSSINTSGARQRQKSHKPVQKRPQRQFPRQLLIN